MKKVCDTRFIPLGAHTDRQIELGDLVFLKLHAENSAWCWEGCDGWHLHAAIPTWAPMESRDVQYRYMDALMRLGIHLWDIDSRGNNCLALTDRTHRCWVRHGDPRYDRITVDQQPDPSGRHSCNPFGMGSILTGGLGNPNHWHGFIRNGELLEDPI